MLIASISGTKPQPRAQYAAAKAAEIHLAHTLARELGPDAIRVNAVSPGSILFEGGSWAAAPRRRARGLRRVGASASSRWRRLGTPKEVADVAAFLLSERASWVSGANVVVEGAQNQPGMRGLLTQGGAADLAARGLRQLVGEVDDPRVLVRRGLAP